MNKYNPDGLHYWAPQRKLGGGWICYKSDPVAPQAPDPVATAAAQTKSNIDTANATANLNHANQITPYGSQNWSSTPNADGTSSWTSTISLAPEQQALLDSSNRVSQSMANLGESQLGTVADRMSQPFNYNGAPQQATNASYGNIQNDIDMSKVPGMVGGDDLRKTYDDAQKAAYGMQTQYLDKSYADRQHDLENKLIQQGVLQGTDAWNRETQNLGQQRTFDYNNAFNNSFDKGLSAQGQLYNQGLSSNQNAYGQAAGNAAFHNTAQNQGFGQAMANANLQNQGRSQSINEANYLRQQPLNELNALRTGAQVSAPQFGSTPQGNVAGTDIAGLYQNQYKGLLDNYNGQVASNNAMTQGLFQLGAAAIGSDRAIKQNIELIGTRPDGLGVYAFDYKDAYKPRWGDGRFTGVMADEVERIYPHAVLRHPDGYQMVNYGALHA